MIYDAFGQKNKGALFGCQFLKSVNLFSCSLEGLSIPSDFLFRVVNIFRPQMHQPPSAVEMLTHSGGSWEGRGFTRGWQEGWLVRELSSLTGSGLTEDSMVLIPREPRLTPPPLGTSHREAGFSTLFSREPGPSLILTQA